MKRSRVRALIVAAGVAPFAAGGGAAIAGESAPAGFRLPGTDTTLRAYGFVEAHGLHDFAQSGTPDVFTDLAYQPLDDAGGRKGRNQFTLETSRLGVEATTPTARGPLTVKVEGDLYGYAVDQRYRPRLRHAYAEYAGWLVGKTWSTFMDVDDLPETVDFNGPVGAPFSRRWMVRYAWSDAATGWALALAAEDPRDQSGGASADPHRPQFVVRIDRSGERGAFNLRLLAHEKRSATTVRQGYGVAAGGRFKASERDLLMAQYTRVDGDIDQLYGANGYAIDAATGAIAFDRGEGLVLGYTRTFSEQLRGSLVFGANRGTRAALADNRRVAEGFANLVWTPVRNVDLGVEYIHGRRRTFDGAAGTLSRLDFMARLSF